MLNYFVNEVCHGLWIPRKLALVSPPPGGYCTPEQPQTCDLASVPKWHCWPNRQGFSFPTLQHWKHTPGHGYSLMPCELPISRAWAETAVINRTEINLRDVQGLAFSRANLSAYSDLDLLAMECAPEMMKPKTIDQAKALLASREEGGERNDLRVYLWQGSQVFVSNLGGSHRLAAARCLAGKLGITVQLAGELQVYRLNTTAVNELIDRFIAVAVHHSQLLDLIEAIQAYGATYIQGQLPPPIGSFTMLLFPRELLRSRIVGARLLRFGVFDLGSWLAERVTIQDKALANLVAQGHFKKNQNFSPFMVDGLAVV